MMAASASATKIVVNFVVVRDEPGPETSTQVKDVGQPGPWVSAARGWVGEEDDGESNG